MKKIISILKRDGLMYTIRRALAWLISYSPLAYRLSFSYYKNTRLMFAPSMLVYRIFANRKTRNGDIKALEDHVKPGDLIIDVGANAGTFSLVAASLTGETGNVLSFEPSPKFANIIKKNVAINSMENLIEVHQVALGAKEGTVYLNESVADDTTNYVSTTGTAVPAATLDSFTDNYEFIDILKIDAEGSELEILNGAIKTLSKTKVLIFELCHKTLVRNGADTQSVYDILQQYFTLYHKNSKEPFTFDPNEAYNTDLIGYAK